MNALRELENRRPLPAWLEKWRLRAIESNLRLRQGAKPYVKGLLDSQADRLLRRIDRRVKEARG